MNDTERAIKALKKWSVTNGVIPDSDYQHFELAILALEKQIPKKAINHYDCHWLCPICNELICDNSYGVEEEYKFCNMCGQAIDWGNEDE